MHNKKCGECYYYLDSTCHESPPKPIAPLHLTRDGAAYSVSVYPTVRVFEIGCGKFKDSKDT